MFEIFNEGEKTCRKANPYTVSKQMRSEKNPDGKKLFSPCEWLTHQQIRGVIASFVSKKQKQPSSTAQAKRLKLQEVGDEQDKLIENIICSLQAAENSDTVQNIANELVD